MIKKDQQRFIRELTKAIRDGILNDIQEGHVPSTWDGHELREWLADRCAQSRTPIKGKQLRSYRNDKLIHNL